VQSHRSKWMLDFLTLRMQNHIIRIYIQIIMITDLLLIGNGSVDMDPTYVLT